MLSIEKPILEYAEQQLVKPPPMHFDTTFYNTCSSIVRDRFNVCISSDITPEMCTTIYKDLVQNL